MPKCPVCNAPLDEPLDEHCRHCMSNWHVPQPDCPSFLRDKDRMPIAQCELGFRHKERRHRATGVVLYEGGPELTISWFWPENHPGILRSPDFQRRHGDGS